MTGRVLAALLLAATSGLATNLPRFAFTASGSLTGYAITMDSRGNTYLTGSVVGNAFTATPGAYQSQNAGGTCIGGGAMGPPLMVPCPNAFVVKLDPSGAIVFATYVGGSYAASSAIAVDSQENVYVVGMSGGGFPVTPGAAFTSGNSFVVKLNPPGTQLVYSTLIPGAVLSSIAADDAGNAYFTGGWSSSNKVLFPATPGAYQSVPPNSLDATIVGKLNASGSALVYGTYLSGDGGAAIAVDAAANVLVAGDAGVYLAKLNSDGSNLIYAATFGPAHVSAMKVAAGGDIYIGCVTGAPGFPVTGGGFGIAPPAGIPNDFLLHVSADGSTVVNSIYLPFALSQSVGGLDVDSAGNAYVVGNADGSLKGSAGAFQSAFSGSGPYDSVIAKITPDGNVAGVTYFGPGGANSLTAIAAERDGSVVVAGLTGSPDFLGGATPPPAAGTNVFFAANFFPAITVENSASYVANAVAPGEMVSIRGYGMGPAAGLNSSPVPEFGGVQVYFDNFAALIAYAQAEQINVQAPWEIAGQTTTQLRIVYNGATAGSATVPVVAALPGVFYIENSDGSFNSPSNPARAGDYVSVYGTGGGAMSPPGVTGVGWPLAPLSSIAQPVSVTVGGEDAGVLYSGSAPTLESGFFQINVRLPADLTAGAQSLYVKIGGVASAPAAISIQ